MWSSRVVMDAAVLDDNLRLLEAVEDCAIEQFIPEFAVEELAIAILPR